MNNSSACPATEEFYRISQIVYFVSYYIGTPVYIIFGLPGHALALLVFYKQYKTQQDYAYQLVCAFNALMVMMTQAVFVFSHEMCATNDQPGPLCVKYRQTYVLMWCEAHLAAPLINTFFTSGVILALSTVIDRLFALVDPVRYRTKNSKLHQSIAIGMSYIIAVVVNAGDCLLYNLEQSELVYTATINGSNLLYSLALNQDYGLSFLGIFSFYSRNFVLVAGIFGLSSCNGVVLVLYHRRNTKIGNMTLANAAKEAERRAHEKTLLILATTESVFKFFAACILISYTAGMLFSENFFMCYDILYTPLGDGCIMVVDTLEFYAALVFSKQIRKTAMDILPFLNRWCGPKVSSASGQIIMISTRTSSFK